MTISAEEFPVSDKLSVPAVGPEVKPIILVSYPKIILLYPTFFASILAAILTYFYNTDREQNQSITVIFLGLMTNNLVVLAFDFPRTTSLIVFFVVVTLGMGVLLLSI